MSASSHAPTLVWFRDDLRIDDNAALTWAAQRGPVVALFVDEDCSAYVSAPYVVVKADDGEVDGGDDDAVVRARPIGAAARWWLDRSLAQLSARLSELGVPFIRAVGDAREVVPAIAQAIGASAVTWNRRYHLPFRDADEAIKLSLIEAGREAVSHPGYLLNEPWRVTSSDGGPYRVFTPYYKAAQNILHAQPPSPLPEPAMTGADLGGVVFPDGCCVVRSFDAGDEPFRAAPLGHPGRCRLRLEPIQLAVGRWMRRRCGPLLPHLQSPAPAGEVRSRQRLRAQVGA